MISVIVEAMDNEQEAELNNRMHSSTEDKADEEINMDLIANNATNADYVGGETVTVENVPTHSADNEATPNHVMVENSDGNAELNGTQSAAVDDNLNEKREETVAKSC